MAFKRRYISISTSSIGFQASIHFHKHLILSYDLLRHLSPSTAFLSYDLLLHLSTSTASLSYDLLRHLSPSSAFPIHALFCHPHLLSPIVPKGSPPFSLYCLVNTCPSPFNLRSATQIPSPFMATSLPFHF